MTDIKKIIEDLEYARYHCTSNKGKDAINDAIDLINRQKAEVEMLCMELDEVIIAKDLLFDEAEALIKKTKAEAIKEFAERLKALDRLDVDVSYGYGREHYTEAIAVNLIDNLVKEIIGEE